MLLAAAVPPVPAIAGTAAVAAASGAGYALGSLVVAICVGVFAAITLVIAIIGLTRNRANDITAAYERGKADQKVWTDFWHGAYNDLRRDPHAPMPTPPEGTP